MALGCEGPLGSPEARFVDTHMTIGAFPSGGMTARPPRIVGTRTAKAMSLSGPRVDAQDG
ncbi:Enoyl-CoA hydratase (fragment) [Frankia canadensis]|uniref:Enoyl-CoA hydratase n=1 Tax=Frankia canadensis TaxID=1836972 RepID=A0A2I2KY23_9ACTN